MPYQFYLVTHFVGISLLLMSLGGIAFHMINGGTRDHASRKLIGMLHGIALLITLVGGFGLLARLGFGGGLPLWAIAKLGIWLVLGAMPAFLYRAPKQAKPLLFATLLLACLAAWTAVYKPGPSQPMTPTKLSAPPPSATP
jgi:hypothetical protein